MKLFFPKRVAPFYLSCFFLFLLIGPSCVKDEISSEVGVYTEEVVYSSGEQVILTGRILAEGFVDVSDHGFQIATDEQFASPTVISLGETTVPGRFVGQADFLETEKSYFCRTFALSKGENIYGNVLPFSTLAPAAIDFSPKEGGGNTKITIEGKNITADTKVLWGDKTITPDAIIAETFIELRSPALENDPAVFIKIVSQGDTSALSQPYEYIIGEWANLGAMDDLSKNSKHIYFEDGDDFVYGIGLAQGNLTNAVHILDKSSLSRSTISFPGTLVESAFYSGGYFGGGSTTKVFNDELPVPAIKDFWKYENQSFIQLADIPRALYKAVALLADDKLYVYGGENSDRTGNNGVYVYDIATDTWSLLNPSPVSPRSPYPSFHLNGFNYMVLANGHTYRHDYTNDTWSRVADFPIEPKQYGISLPLNGVAYVGLQDTNRRPYVYRPDLDEWRTKTSLPDNNPFSTVHGWTYDGDIFVARIQSNNFTNRQLWHLDPDGF